MNRRRLLTVALAAIALAAVFAIGLLVGRQISRPAATSADATAVLDLARYATVPAELIAYRLVAEVPIPLARPTGIASAADGSVYACGDRSLLVLDRTGAVLRRWDLDAEPTCVAAGPDGTLYVGTMDHVEVVRPGGAGGAGTTSRWTGLGSQAIVTSIAVIGPHVLVADAGNRMVLRFDAGGKLVGTLGDDYLVPSPYFDVAGSPDGTVWVADPGRRSVRHYTLDGALLGSWGASSPDIAGFGGCCNPVHIAVCSCGSVITSEKGIPRVKVHEPDGRLEMVVAAASELPPTEAGLDLATRAADGGEVLVLVPSRRVVRVYAKKGPADDG